MLLFSSAGRERDAAVDECSGQSRPPRARLPGSDLDGWMIHLGFFLLSLSIRLGTTSIYQIHTYNTYNMGVLDVVPVSW